MVAILGFQQHGQGAVLGGGNIGNRIHNDPYPSAAHLTLQGTNVSILSHTC